MKSVRDFAFGAFYLVSGIYSMGFGLVLLGIVQPVSGNRAYIPIADGIFPFEVSAFVLFGALFLGASVLHFRSSFRSVMATRPEQIVAGL